MNREIRSFDYVNHPYDAVRAQLEANAAGVLRAATLAASSRAESVAAELRVEIGGLKVAAPIDVEVGTITESAGSAPRGRALHIPISWKSTAHPGLFPSMTAELSVYALTGTETQLDFRGEYTPPLGVLGSAIDAAVGHRIAEASVHRFIAEVAQYLRAHLGGAG
jgi:hypothetical protein